MQQQQQVQQKPIRLKVTKGFYARATGGQMANQFVAHNPGDIIELDFHTARMMVWANKAEETTAEFKRQESYLPERKRNPKPDTQTLLQALVEAVEANTKAIGALVAKSAKAEKAEK